MKISLICGGPSPERGISLNSARSVMDHLGSEDIEIVPFYLDAEKRPYRISRAQLYSNTPSDFDFKLKETAAELSTSQFVRALADTDIVFPVMHGAYGEAGLRRLFDRRVLGFHARGSARKSASSLRETNGYACSRREVRRRNRVHDNNSSESFWYACGASPVRDRD